MNRVQLQDNSNDNNDNLTRRIAACAPGRSRLAARAVKSTLHPVLESYGIVSTKLPASCPIRQPVADLLLPGLAALSRKAKRSSNKGKKKSMKGAFWECLACGEMFDSQRAVDEHCVLNHTGLLAAHALRGGDRFLNDTEVTESGYPVDDVQFDSAGVPFPRVHCAADWCGFLRCDQADARNAEEREALRDEMDGLAVYGSSSSSSNSYAAGGGESHSHAPVGVMGSCDERDMSKRREYCLHIFDICLRSGAATLPDASHMASAYKVFVEHFCEPLRCSHDETASLVDHSLLLDAHGLHWGAGSILRTIAFMLLMTALLLVGGYYALESLERRAPGGNLQHVGSMPVMQRVRRAFLKIGQGRKAKAY